jgi:hypothetical protein
VTSNAYVILLGKPLEERALGRPRNRWENIVESLKPEVHLNHRKYVAFLL